MNSIGARANGKRSWLYSFTILVSLASLSTACSGIRIRDQEWCGDRGDGGATCFHTLDDNAIRRPTKAEWDKERFGMLCTDSRNFADNKKVIQKLCRVAKCSKEQLKILQGIEKNVDQIQAEQKGEELAVKSWDNRTARDH